MKKIYLLDFEDSYSYNLVADIYHFSGILVEVIQLKQHHQFFTSILKSKQAKELNDVVLILGPGPGKPLDYQFQFSALKHLIKMHSPLKMLGICLGHQLLAQIYGMRIKFSSVPMHGQAENLVLDSWWQSFLKTKLKSISVQRYNSLAVEEINLKLQAKYLCNHQEVMLFSRANILSMQFHPESVGTLHKDILFKAIDRFIKS